MAWNRQKFRSEKRKYESNRKKVESQKIDSESTLESHPINAYNDFGIARFESHDSESLDSRFRIADSVPLSLRPMASFLNNNDLGPKRLSSHTAFKHADSCKGESAAIKLPMPHSCEKNFLLARFSQNSCQSRFSSVYLVFEVFHQQLTYGVVREGVIAEKFPENFREISANFPQNFRTLSWRNET